MPRPTRTPEEIQAAVDAVTAMGGATQATRLLCEASGEVVARVTVQKWKTNGVPFAWVPLVSRLSGIPKHRLSRLEPAE